MSQRATFQPGSAAPGDVVAFLRQNMASGQQVDDVGVLAGFNPTTQSEFWALSLDTPPSPAPKLNPQLRRPAAASRPQR